MIDKRELPYLRIIKFAIIALIVVCAYVIFQYLNRPAVGIVNEEVSKPQPIEQVKLNDFETSYFTTKYPERYELSVNKNPSASIASWVLLARQTYNYGPAAKIAVTVTNLPSGGVKNDSAYSQFVAFPDLYSLTTTKYLNDEVFIANRTNPNYEKTALWEYGKYLFIFSMTSGSSNDQLVTELNTLLSNLKFK